MQQYLGVKMGYTKIWRSRQSALASIFDTEDESFAFLPKFIHIVSIMNPGLSFDLVTTSHSHRFRHLFMSVSA